MSRVISIHLLLALAAACGDRAHTADTAAAAGALADTSGGLVAGGDTALLPAPGVGGAPAQGRPAPVPSTASAVAPATPASTATDTAAAATSASSAPPAPGTTTATATSTATAGAPGAVAPVPAAPAETRAAAGPTPARRGRAVVPFGVGERMEYDVKFGALDVGDAAMQVNGIESVRGREAYHTVFRVSGGTLFFKVNDRYESWIDTHTLSSHRHKQQIDEGSYERERVYEMFHDRGVYRENEKPEQKTVDEPLDDGSFFYFVRTIPLEVGRTYEFHRYFKPDRNPVTIKVLRKERVRVPAGSFEAIVIQPLIKTKGIFGEGGRAEIWLADDSTRTMLQMKSQLKFGSLNLYLKKYRAGRQP